MNLDSPKSPREELEARLTALLLGELSADEAAAVRRALAQDAKLAKLHDRLQATIGLVREAVASQVEPTADQPTLKLSDEHREKLLAHFKTVPLLPKLASAQKAKRSWMIPMSVAAALVALFGIAVLTPNFVRSRNTSQANAVLNNLRQLDGAKQQWALENKKSDADVPTMDDLRPYLKGGEDGSFSVAGEKYVLGRVQDDVIAETRRGEQVRWPEERESRLSPVSGTGGTPQSAAPGELREVGLAFRTWSDSDAEKPQERFTQQSAPSETRPKELADTLTTATPTPSTPTESPPAGVAIVLPSDEKPEPQPLTKGVEVTTGFANAWHFDAGVAGAEDRLRRLNEPAAATWGDQDSDGFVDSFAMSNRLLDRNALHAGQNDSASERGFVTNAAQPATGPAALYEDFSDTGGKAVNDSFYGGFAFRPQLDSPVQVQIPAAPPSAMMAPTVDSKEDALALGGTRKLDQRLYGNSGDGRFHDLDGVEQKVAAASNVKAARKSTSTVNYELSKVPTPAKSKPAEVALDKTVALGDTPSLGKQFYRLAGGTGGSGGQVPPPPASPSPAPQAGSSVAVAAITESKRVELVPFQPQLPAPALKGSPEDLPKGPNIEPLGTKPAGTVVLGKPEVVQEARPPEQLALGSSRRRYGLESGGKESAASAARQPAPVTDVLIVTEPPVAHFSVPAIKSPAPAETKAVDAVAGRGITPLGSTRAGDEPTINAGDMVLSRGAAVSDQKKVAEARERSLADGRQLAEGGRLSLEEKVQSMDMGGFTTTTTTEMDAVGLMVEESTARGQRRSIVLPTTHTGLALGIEPAKSEELARAKIAPTRSLRSGLKAEPTTAPSAKPAQSETRVQELAKLDDRIAKEQIELDGLRQKLDVSDADAAGLPSSPLLEAETLRRLEALRIESEAQYAREEKLLEQLKATPKEDLKKVLPKAIQDPQLAELNQQLNLVVQGRTQLKKDFTETHPSVVAANKQAQDLERKIAERADGITRGLEVRVASMKGHLDSLNANVAEAKKADKAKAENSRPYFEKKRELENLLASKRILEARLASENIDLTIPKTTTAEIVDRAVPAQKKTGGLAGLFGGSYASTARVKTDREVSDIRGLSEPSQALGYDPYFIQTEFEVIQSEPVLSNVVRSLDLQTKWGMESAGGQKLEEQQAMALLRGKLDLKSAKGSSLVEIRAKSEDPQEAANLANAVAEAYRDYRSNQRRQLAMAGVQVLEDRFQEQEKKVQQAQAEVEQLRKELTVVNQTTAASAPAVEVDAPPVRKPSTNAPIPQPEVQTSDNAFSTFSLNVSDVAFRLAAASLEKGQMPDAASVRAEEFINAFDYRDPEAPPGVPIAFAWERARYPFAHNRDLLRFSLKTAAAGRQAGRSLNLVLLLDNSGSMERADRVQIIREALRVLAGQLQPQDKLSVITFARTPRLWVDGVAGDKSGEVLDQIGGLTPQGGTNLEEAMNLAYATALRHYLASGINRVVLLTDGAANLGNVEPESLKQKVETHRKQGVAFDCFGIGWEGFNDDLLEVLSRNGDGRYGFINSPDEAATEFAGQLAGALKVAASDVKVQVEFNPKRVTAYRQIGYAKHQLTKEQFRDNTVDAAEIAAQEAGNALYTVEVNPAGEGPLCIVRCRFKLPGTTDYREHEWAVPYTGNAVSLEQASPAMRLAASASAFAEWLVVSPFAAEVTPDALLGYLSGVPEVYGADARPKKLEWMIRQAKSIGGK